MIGDWITGNSGTRYQIVRELGRGGFGVVFLVEDENKKAYALKFIAPITASDARLSFEREVAATAGIDHENILPILDLGACTIGGTEGLFAVSTYCPDGDYRAVLAARTTPGDLATVIGEAEQVLSGLAALHSRTVHRDLKPENVLRAANVLKIGDFGLSRFVDQATRTLTFKGSGTPRYMAPEVWLEQRATPATDLYAFGVILFEAVTGSLPVTATELNTLREEHLYTPAPRLKTRRADVPEGLDGVVKKLLAKEPTARFQSASEVLDALRSSPRPGEPAIVEIATRVREHHDAEERARLEAQRRAQAIQDEAARNRYKENELAALIDEVVAEVNDQLVETKIVAVTSGRDREWRFRNRSLVLHFFATDALYRDLEYPEQIKIFRDRHLVHGGFLEIRENGADREGWNLVLVRPPENLYGEWTIVETRASPLVARRFQFEPAATNAKPFAENLAHHWGHVMHVYQLTDKPLERSNIVKILAVLIPAPTSMR